MTLVAGTRIGSYEILAPIGAGGMGEVYRARDTKLDRDVAIKILPAALALDLERRARFEREAKVLASLNHPNIAQIYGVEDRALIMELIEGENLKGPVAPETALNYAKQIADALEAAHDKGIIHRDLKPANIKVTPQAVIKLLDFGLAKAAEEPVADSQNSPTKTISPTQAGIILGTAAYMSPEQAAGKPVDKRADIWSFGVVLWEMITGERLFQGETVSHILAAVLKDEPDLARVPAKVRPLLRRCLEKDPKKRLRDISGVELLLEQAPDKVQTRARLSSRWAWIITTGFFALGAIAAGSMIFRPRQADLPRILKLSLTIPEGANFHIRGSTPQISPDGRRIVFTPPIEGKADLWVRDLDSLNARMLSGTSDASFPFWSPDSRWVGFFTKDKLKKIDVAGGPAVTVCNVRDGRGGTWSKDGVIVYATLFDGLLRVAADGGTPAVIVGGGPGHVGRYPWFLPDGRHFLYGYTNGGIWANSIDARPGYETSKKVLDVDSNAVYVPPLSSSPGYLLFLRERTLIAQPFDASKIQITGDPAPVAEKVAFVSPPAAGQFSSSQNGTLVYAIETARNKQLTWFDRHGKPLRTIGAPADMLAARISPDGSTIATDLLNADGSARDIWLYDTTRETSSRFTFLRDSVGLPTWSPDGSRIAFLGNYGQPYIKARTGNASEQPLAEPGHPIWDWSHDGKWMIRGGRDIKTQNDCVWVFPQFGDKRPFIYLSGEYNVYFAKLSPNGHYLAYVSDESKRREIYVQTFPEHGGKWQISANGGDYPVWSPDGRELYYISADRKMMAIETRGDGKNFLTSAPSPLFDVPVVAWFDVSGDGRFVIQVPVEPGSTNTPLTLVLNWQMALKK